MVPTDAVMDARGEPAGAFARWCEVHLGPLRSRWSRCVADRDVLMLLPECTVVLGIVVLLWASVFLMLSQQYETTERAAVRDTGNLARAFEENTQRVVRGVDDILLSLRSDYAKDPEGFDVRAWQHGHMRADRLNVQLGIIGANGWLRHSTMGPPGSKADTPHYLADREHFRVHLDSAHDDLFISQALVGRGSDTWTIQFTRKLLRADGSFDGVIVFSLGCEELSRFYNTLDIGNGVILLIGTDGLIRARAPIRDGALGAEIHDQIFSRMLRTQREGHYTTTGQTAGTQRIISFRRIPDLPLIVAVGFDRAQVFQGYGRQRSHLLLIGGISTAVIVLFGILWIVLRRRWIVSRRLLRLTLENISQGIILVDASGRTPIMNKRAVELLGHSGQGNMLAPAEWLSTPEGGQPQKRGATTPGADPAAGDVLTEVARDDGKIIEVHRQPTSFGGTVLTYTDITERKLSEGRILHLAHHDALTGLPNRILLAQNTAQAIEDARRSGGHIAILCLDLDNFKEVNDTMGHDAGDVVLQRFAERLRLLIRPNDVVARIGGDEFIILTRDLVEPCVAEEIAERLLAGLSMPVDLGGYVWQIGTSIGVAVYPEDGTDSLHLLKNADTALYRAKAETRGGYRRFQPWMDQSLIERRALEHDLREAIERDQFEVYFQPQFTCDTLRVVGFEALIRWHHPVRGNVPPGVFIPLAEECALIVPIGRMVLQRACALAARWQPSCRVAVNLSPVQFRDDTLITEVSRALANTGLQPGMLELEVTEGVLIKDGDQALDKLRELKALGVNIALDDFGTGYSSLSYLRSFPFDRIKIDRSFVVAQEKDSHARAIVEAVLTMSSRLKLEVTAEGVENESQLALLRKQGCGEIQGYLLGEPMPSGDVQDFLDTVAGTRRRDGRHLILVSSQATAAAQGSRQTVHPGLVHEAALRVFPT